MMAPREPVVESSKLSWLAETEGGAATINPGLDAEDFKNLKWEGGAVPTRTELDTALHGYFELTWPATAQHFAGGGMRGTSAGQWDAQGLPNRFILYILHLDIGMYM